MQLAEKMQPQKMMGFPEYIEALEGERRKIQVFHRELPLSLELVTQAIEACRQQLSGTTTEYNLNGQSECSEQTSTEEGPVFAEFIPIKKRPSPDHSDDEDGADNDYADDDDDDDDDEQHSRRRKIPRDDDNTSSTDKKKSDWLRSVQLWNPDPSAAKEDVPRKASVVEVRRSGGAFQPFHREESAAGKPNASSPPPAGNKGSSSPAVPSASSTGPSVAGGSGGSCSKREERGQSQRKQRRCWSQELHKRFLHALQQLGGPDSATPKQIRELMKVDGLTNDEVKSHLQKFRLHTRRPSSMVPNNANSQTAPLFIVGNIFVQPQEYAAAATSTAASGELTAVTAAPSGIYAPVAAAPPPAVVPHTPAPSMRNPQFKRLEASEHSSHSEERANHSEGAAHSDSPASSSSTQTTTTSPDC